MAQDLCGKITLCFINIRVILIFCSPRLHTVYLTQIPPTRVCFTNTGINNTFMQGRTKCKHVFLSFLKKIARVDLSLLYLLVIS